jgi:hypothetical protein
MRKEGWTELTECVHCGHVTLNGESDTCACGQELYPVSKNVPPGTRLRVLTVAESLSKGFDVQIGEQVLRSGHNSIEQERAAWRERSDEWQRRAEVAEYSCQRANEERDEARAEVSRWEKRVLLMEARFRLVMGVLDGEHDALARSGFEWGGAEDD